MSTVKKYRFNLDTSSKKFSCPACGRKTFVRVVDSETSNYLPDQVGRCDRESNCGHEYSAKQYLTDMGAGFVPVVNVKTEVVKPEIIDYLSHDLVEKSMQGFKQSNFAVWLIALVGEEKASEALIKYLVGRSKSDDGKAVVFWRLDIDGNPRTAKVMAYNPLTGKRAKDKGSYFIHPQQNFNCKLSFFGEHLLSEYPDKPIGITESEKSAVIASIFMPDMVWLATGGNSGCKWREYSVHKVLKNRNVIFYPDLGYYNKKKQITCFTEWANRVEAIRERMPGNFKVSRILEDTLPEAERVNDVDIADELIKKQLTINNL